MEGLELKSGTTSKASLPLLLTKRDIEARTFYKKVRVKSLFGVVLAVRRFRFGV
jgi:hypothetical protein